MHLGKKVIHDSAKSLMALHQNFPESFPDVVHLLSNISGKVVCTGMGKSHHVAEKIAATLASTGTPAFFVHPAESMHGDLGMIQENDGVLALSLSGETAETIQLLKHSPTRLSIAITAKPHSTMARLASWVLSIPEYPESCPLGLAPTTSCLMMMALGDALALSLLSRKNFSKQDFRAFHPCGSLGQALKPVTEMMQPAPVFPENTPFKTMLTQWIALQTPLVGLMNPYGVLTATITASDIQSWSAWDTTPLLCSEIPVANPLIQNQYVLENTLWMDAVKLMNDTGQKALLVMNEHTQAIGIIYHDHCGKNHLGKTS
jgi:arabinose-5-phosphate isomerase